MQLNFTKKYIIFFILIGSLACLFFIFSLQVFTSAQTASPDAIAIRIISNPNHYSAYRWYKEQGFSGSPQSLKVDGYEAVRDGRTVYVNAANVDMANNDLYTNIYIISYNQAAETATVDIFGSILKHWKFNTNLTNVASCMADITRICLTNEDCASGDYCRSPKAEVIRDTERLAELREMHIALGKYGTTHDGYPQLPAGSYLPGRTISTWPSWQNVLAQLLSESLPLDPINKLGECEGFNPITCWNEVEKAFAGTVPDGMPDGSKVYAYESVNQWRYHICAQFESAYDNLEADRCFEDALDNSPPQITDYNLSGIPRQEFTGYVRAFDPDGDNLDWSVELVTPTANPEDWEALGWAWEAGEDNFTITRENTPIPIIELYAPAAGDSSTEDNRYEIRVTVTDTRGASDTRIFEVSIGSYDIELNPTGGEIIIGQDRQFRVTGIDGNLGELSTDLNFDRATYNGEPITTEDALRDHGFRILGMNVNEVFSTGPLQRTGQYVITVYAVNLTNGQQADADVTVSIINNPPEFISAIATYRDDTHQTCLQKEGCNFMIDNGENATIDISARDPDPGHTVSYAQDESLPMPSGVDIDPVSGEITGLENLFAGETTERTADLSVRIEDNYCDYSLLSECSTTTSFSITVMPYCSVPDGVNSMHYESDAAFQMNRNQITSNDLMRDIGFPPPDSCSTIGNGTADITRTSAAVNKAIIFVIDASASMSGAGTCSHNATIACEINDDCNATPFDNNTCQFLNPPINSVKDAVIEQLNSIRDFATSTAGLTTVKIGLIKYAGRASNLYNIGVNYFWNGGQYNSNIVFFDASNLAVMDELIDQVNYISAQSPPGTGTHTYGALYRAREMMESTQADFADEKVVILLSDGAPLIRYISNCTASCYDDCCWYCGCPCNGSPFYLGDWASDFNTRFNNWGCAPACATTTGGYPDENGCKLDCPASGGGGGGGGTSLNTEADFKIAVTYPYQDQCRDASCIIPSVWCGTECIVPSACPTGSQCGLKPVPYVITQNQDNCDLTTDVNTIADTLSEGLGVSLYTIYYDTGGSNPLLNKANMCNWSSENAINCDCINSPLCGYYFAFSADEADIDEIFEGITSDIISKPSNVTVSGGLLVPFVLDDPLVTEETIPDWTGISGLLSCLTQSPLFAQFDQSGQVVIDNIEFDYCPAFLHPLPYNPCSTFVGCHVEAPAGAVGTTGDCAGNASCYECVSGSFWNQAECVEGCEPTCSTGPFCRTSLVGGEVVAGDCCGNGSCYDCASPNIWNETFGLCMPVCDGTYYVDQDGGADYRTITEAVYNACDGATIIVLPSDGEYQENIVITKGITIIGEGDRANIRVRSRGSNTFTIRHDNVSISNLTIYGHTGSQRAAISVENASNVSIENNVLGLSGDFNRANYGVRILGGSGHIIRDNEIVDYGLNGIYVDGAENIEISGNTIGRSSYDLDVVWTSDDRPSGIVLLYVTGANYASNNIANNIIRNNYNGIEISESNNFTFESNTISNSHNGFILSQNQYGRISTNEINSDSMNYGIHGQGAGENYLIEGNVITGENLYALGNNSRTLNLGAFHAAINIWGMNNSQIIENNLSNNLKGLVLTNSNGNNIERNNISNNKLWCAMNPSLNFGGAGGGVVMSGNNNVIRDNVINGNGTDGIAYGGCHEGCEISNNEINDNIIGGIFLIYDTEQVHIIGNRIRNNGTAQICGEEYIDGVRGFGIHMRAENLNGEVIGNIIENHYYTGLFVCCGNRNYEVAGNIVSGGEYAFIISADRNNNIHDNEISGYSHGSLIYTSYSTISNNRFFGDDNTYGWPRFRFYGHDNIIYLNQFDENLTTQGSSYNNQWHSPSPIGYTYNGSNYNGYLGNYFVNSDKTDVAPLNGVADDRYAIPGPYTRFPQEYDDYPLVSTPDNY